MIKKKGGYEGQITTLKKKIGENVKKLMSRMYIVHFSFNYKKCGEALVEQ